MQQGNELRMVLSGRVDEKQIKLLLVSDNKNILNSMFHDAEPSDGQQFQQAQDNIEYLNFNKSEDIDRLLSTRQQFRKTVKQNVQLKFQKISHLNSNKNSKNKNHFQNISFQSQASNEGQWGRAYDDEGSGDGISGLGYYYENNENAQLVYKKTRNLGTNWIGQREYFTSLFASVQSIEKLKPKCLFGKIKQLQPNQTENPLISIDTTKNTSHTNIQFDSDFQSGNLFAAYKVGVLEYDLLLQNDINTKGNTQWFYFRIQNLPVNKKVKLNIVNFRKSDSLFNYGMLPCVYSQEADKKNREGWVRKGQKVKYFRNSHPIQGSRKYYYTLTFTVMTEHPNDILKVAQCYPYTTADLHNYFDQIQKVNYKRNWCQKVTVMPKTLAGNKIESLVIKETNPKFRSNQSRPLIILLARQHPGETPGSFMIEGLIEYLLSKDKDSQFIRKNYEIRAIPMVNPDGVQCGNYRTNLYGVDLNRKWDCSIRQRQSVKTQKDQNLEASQVIYIKRYISTHAKNRQIAYILDFHGHSRKLYSFFYGNSCPQSPSDVKIFPYICSKLTSMIRYEDCTFNLQEDKRNTARVQLFSNLKIANIYTFQASFFGYINKNKEKRAFTIENYKNLGMIIGKAIYICEKRKQESQVQGKQKILYQKWLRELTLNASLIKVGQNQDSGSESCPSEWEVMELQKKALEQQFALQKEQQSKRKSVTAQKLARQKFRHQNLTSAKQPLKSLRHMQVMDIARVNSIFPNDILALVPNNFYMKPTQKLKKQIKSCSVQTDPCPIIKVYESCKAAEIEPNDGQGELTEGKSAVFERTKARSIGEISSMGLDNSSMLVQTTIKNFSSLSAVRSKSIHEKQLFENARHLSALKKSTEIRKHFKKVLTEHQLAKPKSQLIKNDSTLVSKKTHRHVQTVISFHKETIVKQPIKETTIVDELRQMSRRQQRQVEANFFCETPEKKEKTYKEMETSKFWTIEAKRKSLGTEEKQPVTPLSRNQFRKTTVLTRNIMRSNSNHYYDSEKAVKNEKLIENWRIKKKSLI